MPCYFAFLCYPPIRPGGIATVPQEFLPRIGPCPRVIVSSKAKSEGVRFPASAREMRSRRLVQPGIRPEIEFVA